MQTDGGAGDGGREGAGAAPGPHRLARPPEDGRTHPRPGWRAPAADGADGADARPPRARRRVGLACPGATRRVGAATRWWPSRVPPAGGATCWSPCWPSCRDGLAAAFIRLPYVIISPGDATPVGEVVTVQGRAHLSPPRIVAVPDRQVTHAAAERVRDVAGWLSPDDDVFDEATSSRAGAAGGAADRRRRHGPLPAARYQGGARAPGLPGGELLPGVAVLAVEPGGPTDGVPTEATT